MQGRKRNQRQTSALIDEGNVARLHTFSPATLISNSQIHFSLDKSKTSTEIFLRRVRPCEWIIRQRLRQQMRLCNACTVIDMMAKASAYGWSGLQGIARFNESIEASGFLKQTLINLNCNLDCTFYLRGNFYRKLTSLSISLSFAFASLLSTKWW